MFDPMLAQANPLDLSWIRDLSPAAIVGAVAIYLVRFLGPKWLESSEKREQIRADADIKMGQTLADVISRMDTLMREEREFHAHTAASVRDVINAMGQSVVSAMAPLQEGLERVVRKLEQLDERVNQNTLVTLEHDAAVRGKNPEIVGTTEEIRRRAGIKDKA